MTFDTLIVWWWNIALSTNYTLQEFGENTVMYVRNENKAISIKKWVQILWENWEDLWIMSSKVISCLEDFNCNVNKVFICSSYISHTPELFSTIWSACNNVEVIILPWKFNSAGLLVWSSDNIDKHRIVEVWWAPRWTASFDDNWEITCKIKNRKTNLPIAISKPTKHANQDLLQDLNGIFWEKTFIEASFQELLFSSSDYLFNALALINNIREIRRNWFYTWPIFVLNEEISKLLYFAFLEKAEIAKAYWLQIDPIPAYLINDLPKNTKISSTQIYDICKSKWGNFTDTIDAKNRRAIEDPLALYRLIKMAKWKGIDTPNLSYILKLFINNSDILTRLPKEVLS